MGSHVGSWWCPDRCQNHKMACLLEGQSSHKHLRERRFHACKSKWAERKNTALNWDLPAALFPLLSNLPRGLYREQQKQFPTVLLDEQFQTAVLAGRRCSLRAGLLAWRRRCCEAACPTSYAAEMEEQRLHWVLARPCPRNFESAPISLSPSQICYTLYPHHRNPGSLTTKHRTDWMRGVFHLWF